MLIRFFDPALEHLERGLAFAARRHQVLTENIANLDTPGYRARDLVRDDPLPPAGVAVVPAGGPVFEPRLVPAGDGRPGPSGNDIDLDRQMGRLAENALFQQALVRILARQFDTLRQAISGRV